MSTFIRNEINSFGPTFLSYTVLIQTFLIDGSGSRSWLRTILYMTIFVRHEISYKFAFEHLSVSHMPIDLVISFAEPKE